MAFCILSRCTILQHTSTYCNILSRCTILQHTSTYCNTLQHTATHCNTLQHTATHCNPLQPAATRCNPLQPAATYVYTQWNILNRLCNLHSLFKGVSLRVYVLTFYRCTCIQCAEHAESIMDPFNTLQHTATHCHTHSLLSAFRF